jgi:hypothetical protein
VVAPLVSVQVRAVLDGTSGTAARSGVLHRWRAVRRDEFPTDAFRRYPVWIRWSWSSIRPLAAGHLQGPVMMTIAQRTTSFLWCGKGATHVAGLHVDLTARRCRRRGSGPGCRVGLSPAVPVPCARSRARSSVGERCLHTAEVRGSIPLVPTAPPGTTRPPRNASTDPVGTAVSGRRGLVVAAPCPAPGADACAAVQRLPPPAGRASVPSPVAVGGRADTHAPSCGNLRVSSLTPVPGGSGCSASGRRSGHPPGRLTSVRHGLRV